MLPRLPSRLGKGLFGILYPSWHLLRFDSHVVPVYGNTIIWQQTFSAHGQKIIILYIFIISSNTKYRKKEKEKKRQ